MVLSYLTVKILAIISAIGFFVGLWSVFVKAGYKGWWALIPGYNLWIWLKLLSRPWWWIILALFPFISIFMIYMMIWKTIRLFGKTSYLPLILGTFFFFIYLPYLGFSKKENYSTLADLPKFHKSATREWIDALIFAVAAAFIFRTFLFEFYKIPTSSMESSLMVGDFLAVDKMAFGGRIPETILAIPFVHHTVPLTKSVSSYVEWITLPFMRFPAINPIQRNDVVVFNYPDGDTVAIERQNESYYEIVRDYETILNPNAPDYAIESMNRKYPSDYMRSIKIQNAGPYYEGKGRELVHKLYKVQARPVDKRENYVKRCIAIPGDTLEIINTEVFINGQLLPFPERVQFSYYVLGNEISKKKRKSLNINEEDWGRVSQDAAFYRLSDEQKRKIEEMGNEVVEIIDEEGKFDYSVFPHDPRYAWNKDNFGKLVVPKRGTTVLLNDSTVALYDKVIRNYELNELEVREGKVYVNGKETIQYTFKMDYYFMMGDNRHNSMDSRFWGFVPEDHIVGKASFVWLSLDKFKDMGEGKIRWKRMFKKIR